jgi:6-phosphogluconolactonase
MNNIRWAPFGGAEAVADHVGQVLGRAGARIAMPGGSTPGPVLEMLAGRDLGAEAAEIIPTDDRLVPMDHPASNYGLLSKTLTVGGVRVLPLREGDPVARFNLVWIGMGADGHIASIFPSAMNELAEGRWVVRTRPEPLPAEAPYERLTLTLQALADTDETILVIRGAEKKSVLRRAMNGEEDWPITRLIARSTAPFKIYWRE